VQKIPESSRIQIDFGPTAARVRYETTSGRRELRQFELPRGTIILDDNVVHQYELAAMRYSNAVGGKQSFHAFIPQEGVPGVLTLEALGTETISVDHRQESCRHLLMTTDMARVDLWTDPQDRLRKLEIPSAGLVAFRKQ
jgi:hypothetical protein